MIAAEQRLARGRRRGEKYQPLRHHHVVLGRVDEVQHLGRLHDRDGLAELLTDPRAQVEDVDRLVAVLEDSSKPTIVSTGTFGIG